MLIFVDQNVSKHPEGTINCPYICFCANLASVFVVYWTSYLRKVMVHCVLLIKN